MYDVFQSYSPYFLLQLLLSFNSFWNSSNIPFPVSWAHLPTPCLFHNSPNPVSSVHTHRHARQSTGAWSAHQGPHPQRKPILPPQSPWIANSISARDGGLCVPSPSLLECWQLWQLGLVQAIPAAANSLVQWSCSIQMILLLPLFPISGSYKFSALFFWNVP